MGLIYWPFRQEESDDANTEHYFQMRHGILNDTTGSTNTFKTYCKGPGNISVPGAELGTAC